MVPNPDPPTSEESEEGKEGKRRGGVTGPVVGRPPQSPPRPYLDLPSVSNDTPPHSPDPEGFLRHLPGTKICRVYVIPVCMWDSRRFYENVLSSEESDSESLSVSVGV